MSNNTAIKTWQERYAECLPFNPASTVEADKVMAQSYYFRSQREQSMLAEIAELRAALEAVQPAAQQGDGELPVLPAPYGVIPVYDDDEAGTQTHEVDGWTAAQMRGYAIDYGAQLGRAAIAQRVGSGAVVAYVHRSPNGTQELIGKSPVLYVDPHFPNEFKGWTKRPLIYGDSANPDSGHDAALCEALADGYEGGLMVDQDLAGMVTLHYISPSHAENAFEAISNAISAQRGEKGGAA